MVIHENWIVLFLHNGQLFCITFCLPVDLDVPKHGSVQTYCSSCMQTFALGNWAGFCTVDRMTELCFLFYYGHTIAHIIQIVSIIIYEGLYLWIFHPVGLESRIPCRLFTGVGTGQDYALLIERLNCHSPKSTNCTLGAHDCVFC